METSVLYVKENSLLDQKLDDHLKIEFYLFFILFVHFI